MLRVNKDFDQIGVALRIGQRAKAGAEDEGFDFNAGIVVVQRCPGALHQQWQSAAERPAFAETSNVAFPPWRWHHVTLFVVHQRGQLLHLGQPGALQGTFFRGSEKGDQ